MITEDYVSFETAKLLKKKKFYQDFLSEITPVWKLNGNRTELAFYGCDNYPCETDEWYSAPTLQMAMKWLRETFKFHCQIECPITTFNWVYGIRDLNKDEWVTTFRNMGDYETYEEACDAAIKYCLENLI